MPLAEPKLLKPRFDERKFKELLLYFAERCEDDPAFGATKLNKLLWVTDFLHYARRGAPLTGATYFSLPYGPAPKQMKPVLSRMQGKDLVLKRIDRYGKTQNRVIPLRPPDLSVLKAEEIAVADEAIHVLWDANASDVSGWTHEFRGWRLAGPGETIPYESFFLSEQQLSGELLEHAKQVVTAHDSWRSESGS